MPASSTYTPIATQTTSSLVNQINFGSIPSTYTDLIVVLDGAVDGTSGVTVRFNGDTAANYGYSAMATQSGTSPYLVGNYGSFDRLWLGGYVAYWPSAANARASLILQIQNYSNTTTFKPFTYRDSVPTINEIAQGTGVWRSTSAINSILLYTSNAHNFRIGTTASLYGITAA